MYPIIMEECKAKLTKEIEAKLTPTIYKQCDEKCKTELENKLYEEIEKKLLKKMNIKWKQKVATLKAKLPKDISEMRKKYKALKDKFRICNDKRKRYGKEMSKYSDCDDDLWYEYRRDDDISD